MKDFEELYERYYGRLFAYCLTLTKNRADAEDIASEAFYRALTGRASFRAESSVMTFLCGIAKKVFLEEQRRRKRKALPDPTPDLFDFEDREDAQRILLTMNSLDEPYRSVFLYRAVGGMEYADIARLFEKNANWAYVVYHRAKNKIKEALTDE